MASVRDEIRKVASRCREGSKSVPDLYSEIVKVQAAVDATEVGPFVKARTHEWLEEMSAACRLREYCASDRFDLGRHQREGGPTLGTAVSRIRRADEELRRLAEMYATHRPAPDGWTAGELRREAEIGRELFQKLVHDSGLPPTDPGNAQRRYGIADVKRLIGAATRHGKRKGPQTARDWQRLVDLAMTDAV